MNSHFWYAVTRTLCSVAEACFDYSDNATRRAKAMEIEYNERNRELEEWVTGIAEAMNEPFLEFSQIVKRSDLNEKARLFHPDNIREVYLRSCSTVMAHLMCYSKIYREKIERVRRVRLAPVLEDTTSLAQYVRYAWWPMEEYIVGRYTSAYARCRTIVDIEPELNQLGDEGHQYKARILELVAQFPDFLAERL